MGAYQWVEEALASLVLGLYFRISHFEFRIYRIDFIPHFR